MAKLTPAARDLLAMFGYLAAIGFIGSVLVSGFLAALKAPSPGQAVAAAPAVEAAAQENKAAGTLPPIVQPKPEPPAPAAANIPSPPYAAIAKKKALEELGGRRSRGESRESRETREPESAKGRSRSRAGYDAYGYAPPANPAPPAAPPLPNLHQPY